MSFDINAPTNQKYTLKCFIKIMDVSYDDVQSKKTERVTEKMVFLLPSESTECDLFYDAWLPDTDIDYSEIGCQAGHPVYGVFRAAVKRRSKDCERPHIFVMTKSVEDILLKMDGKEIVIDVLPESEDEKMDRQRDIELTGRLKHYNDTK